MNKPVKIKSYEVNISHKNGAKEKTEVEAYSPRQAKLRAFLLNKGWKVGDVREMKI